MSTVVKPNKNAPEDKALLRTFTLTSNAYWLFNVFTQIAESLDCIVHLWITVVSISRWQNHTELPFIVSSVMLNMASIILKWSSFGSLNPFYFLINNSKSKYCAFSRFRLIQLFHRYHDIVQRFFKKRRSTNATKNFGYLNVSILARVYIEDFGAPRFPMPDFAAHELFESLPQCVLLFIYITYLGINNPLYTASILLSLLCISCQIFNLLATSNNIHYSILGARFLCVITDIFGSFAMLSCLYYICATSLHHTHHIIGGIVYIFYLKFALITLPFSLALSWLFVFRAFAFYRHRNDNTLLFILQIPLVFALIICAAMLAAVPFEICFNFCWLSLLIHRLFNQRFSYWDGNNNFWRRIIEWMLKKDAKTHRYPLQTTQDKVLRLFSVNFNLCSYIEKFKDVPLMQWMDDVYKYVFYTYYYESYEIHTGDFNNYSETNISDSYKAIFEMIVNEQIAHYFRGHNQSRYDIIDIVQYMADYIQLFNFGNVLHRSSIETCCSFVFGAVLYFTLWISTPLYFVSRIINVIFPLIVMMTAPHLAITSFPFIIGFCYYLSMFLLAMTWFVNINIFGFCIQCGDDVSSLIYSLCPSLLRQGELYVSLKYGYFTQHELFERILWHYDRHKCAQKEGQVIVDIFGKDIAREIVDFFPRCYSEEKIFMSE